jgi:sugar (pentulose or hexulose) kinase
MDASAADLTLVIDIGKSNAKLLLLDKQGTVVERHSRANASVQSALGYPALDVHGLAQWMQQTMAASPHAQRCGHVITSTHGAALVALDDKGLAWEPLDYEYEAVAQDSALQQAFAAGSTFAETLSPELPAGLNAARQLGWMQNNHPEAWQRTRCLMPYAQYWAWLLSGVACSEVSSLGCHTHLWNPNTASYSRLAQERGWAALFAPLRKAWEVVGPVRAEVAQQWGLPARAQVHVGVHDSNACLARYLPRTAAADAAPQSLTLVSSGTWTVLMAPGASAHDLTAEKDMLANVDVTERMTPTARFMGGREFAVLLDGASPDAASWEAVQSLIDAQVMALPAFAAQGGPFAGRAGSVVRGAQALPMPTGTVLTEVQRAALAALYCAQMTCWLIQALWGSNLGAHRVIVEGPLAHNPVYLGALQALLPGANCFASVDTVEGTARGAWCLAQDADAAQSDLLKPVSDAHVRGLGTYHGNWLARL